MRKHLAWLVTTYLLATFSPSASAEIHPQAQSVAQQYGFFSAHISCENEEVVHQQHEYNNQINFSAAMISALNTFIADHGEAENLLSMLLQDAFDELKMSWVTPPPPEVLAHAQLKLRSLLGTSSTLFALVPAEPLKPIFAPERGEHIADSWQFFLSIPSYSDHLFWAIVDRSGAKAPYSYGFN